MDFYLIGLFHCSRLVGNQGFFEGREQSLHSWLGSAPVEHPHKGIGLCVSRKENHHTKVTSLHHQQNVHNIITPLQIKQDHCRVCISRRALKGKKYLFRDIHNFSFSAKIQDGRQKWRKLKFFP